ncbi:hypothetical protein Tco_1539129 [Tanacetum coccineum]
MESSNSNSKEGELQLTQRLAKQRHSHCMAWFKQLETYLHDLYLNSSSHVVDAFKLAFHSLLELGRVVRADISNDDNSVCQLPVPMIVAQRVLFSRTSGHRRFLRSGSQTNVGCKKRCQSSKYGSDLGQITRSKLFSVQTDPNWDCFEV